MKRTMFGLLCTRCPVKSATMRPVRVVPVASPYSARAVVVWRGDVWVVGGRLAMFSPGDGDVWRLDAVLGRWQRMHRCLARRSGKLLRSSCVTFHERSHHRLRD